MAFIDPDKKEFGAWWMWILGLVIVAVVAFTGLSYFGIIGKTVVERVVFENSHQYKQAGIAASAMYNAQLTEIQRKLMNQNLDPNTRANLEASASAIRVRLAAEGSK